jgi:hypothetical protein
MYSYFFPVFLFPRCIPYVFRYFSWINQEYLEEVGIHGGSRNTVKKKEYME